MDTLINTNEIPIIDLSKPDINKLSIELDRALTELGTALLINHGIPEEKFKNGVNVFGKFCALPDDIKQLYNREQNMGYIKQGQESFEGFQEIHESFNYVTTAKDFYPDKYVPGFSDAVNDITKNFHSIMTLMVKCFAKSFDFPEDDLLKLHAFLNEEQRFGSAGRIIHYPEVSDDKADRKNIIRCGAHCDYGAFTFLWQDSEGGLEIFHPKQKVWRRVGDFNGAILINVGDSLNMWSNNRYHSLEHRVVVPEEKSLRRRARNSFAFFVCPEPQAPLLPLEHIKDKSYLKLDNYMTSEQHLKKRISDNTTY